MPLKDVTVPERRQARFECVLTREANVIWSKGPDIIKSSDKFDIIADGKKHILVINDSHFDDEGVYTAEVDGKKSSARLFVTGKICEICRNIPHLGLQMHDFKENTTVCHFHPVHRQHCGWSLWLYYDCNMPPTITIRKL